MDMENKVIKTLTCQAISEEDRKKWMAAMGGKQPEPLQSRDSNKQVLKISIICIFFVYNLTMRRKQLEPLQSWDNNNQVRMISNM